MLGFPRRSSLEPGTAKPTTAARRAPASPARLGTRAPPTTLVRLRGGPKPCKAVIRLTQGAFSLLTDAETTTYGVAKMDKPKDFYSILGVAPDAPISAIRQAYRRLARRLDPQVSADVKLAYETLSDVERRQRYDELLRQPQHAPAWSLVRGPVATDLRRPVTPGTLAGEIVLTPSEARQGTVLSLDMPLVTACPSCKGTGGSAFDCAECQGEGKLQHRLPVPVRIVPGVKPGTVFQVFADESEIQTILLTVHIRSV